MIDDRRIRISTQVLREYAVAARSKLQHDEPTITGNVESLARLPLVDEDLPTILRAVTIQFRYQIAFWDALILSAAEKSGCDILLTEDLNHGQLYGDILVHNPFLPPPDPRYPSQPPEPSP